MLATDQNPLWRRVPLLSSIFFVLKKSARLPIFKLPREHIVSTFRKTRPSFLKSSVWFEPYSICEVAESRLALFGPLEYSQSLVFSKICVWSNFPGDTYVLICLSVSLRKKPQPVLTQRIEGLHVQSSTLHLCWFVTRGPLGEEVVPTLISRPLRSGHDLVYPLILVVPRKWLKVVVTPGHLSKPSWFLQPNNSPGHSFSKRFQEHQRCCLTLQGLWRGQAPHFLWCGI